jgi:indolepyruvate ferredoxin oxidoreductase
VVVTDEPEKYAGIALPAGVTVHHRSELDAIQRRMREMKGVTVLVYDQTCAAEKRRRRKKNKGTHVEFPDPPKRMLINPAVCEGCGDCGVQSNCLSILPLETELGRKRQIEQSSCNKDYSCVEGFCPSFVSVIGGKLKKPAAATVTLADLEAILARHPAPAAHDFARPFELLVAGVGGTGVVTVGALITMAAHLEGKGASTLDFMGFAQKGGAVMSHVRLAASPARLNQVRIDLQQADAVLACDLVVAAMPDALAVMRREVTKVVANEREIPTAEFTGNPDAIVPREELLAKIHASGSAAGTFVLNAQDVALEVLGDPIVANILLMGYAWQQGLIPVGLAAMMRAIELNNVAIDMNKRAFTVGRVLAADQDALARLRRPDAKVIQFAAPRPLEEMVAFRREQLAAYQDAAYAERYVRLVGAIEAKERDVTGAGAGAGAKLPITRAVARNLYKLMAYKDEYEVARLHADPAFRKLIAEQFEGDYTLQFHLAAPLVSKKRPGTGIPAKRTFGPWMMRGFELLRRLKFLRATPFDLFGYTQERRTERALRDDYIAQLESLVAGLTRHNRDAALKLAQLPEKIRGFGHVKLANLAAAQKEQAELVRQFNSPTIAIAIQRAG